jgi:UDP-N-acetylglucosamine 2-epimerase (non-hydrolysing)
MKLKVATVIGTRPEIIRLSRVISKLDKYCEHFIIHTGQNYDYELNEIFFNDFNIRKPDFFLSAAMDSPAASIGAIISLSDEVLKEINPDALLVLGDTNSCLSAISAKRRKIPIFHMEAGNRCFDMRVPEEINRKIVDHIADINMPYSSLSKQYLIKEGINPDTIITTGSPMKEVLFHSMNNINDSNILNELDLKEKEFFVVSCHREENVEPKSKISKLVEILNKMSLNYDFPIIFSAHPRTRKRIEELSLKLSPKVKLIKPLNFSDYNKLQLSSKLVLSDSGTINEEASILGFDAVNIRDTHERPEAMEEAATIMTGFNETRIFQALQFYEKSNEHAKKIVYDYNVDNVSDKVVKIIHSYTDFVQRNTWKNYE